MKQKLLLALLALFTLGGSNLFAQTWTGNAVAEGNFYFYNIGQGKWLSSGNSWGTQATLLEAGGFCSTLELSDGKYAIKNTEIRTNDKASGPGYLGTNAYMDSESAAYFTFTQATRTDGVTAYYIQNGETNLQYSGEGTTVVFGTETGDNAQWVLITKDDRLAAMANASEDNPVDATFLLKNPEFGRYKLPAYDVAWTWTFPGGTNKNNAGDNTNFCVESYHVAFDFCQAVENAPTGYYAVRGQAFYRQDGNDNTNLPYFYVGDQTVAFPAKTGDEGSMGAASTSFTAGNYQTAWSSTYTYAGGTLNVGTHLNTNTALWCIWDNIQIQYYGPIDLSEFEAQLAAAVSAAQAYESQLPAAVYANIESVITANNKTWSTADEYSAAITAINNAVSTYATADIIADYARYLNIRTAVLTINSGIDVTAANTQVEAATTTEGIDAAILTLRNALTAYLPTAQLGTGETIDLTDALIDNAAPGISGTTDYWTNSNTPALQFKLWEFYNISGATTKQVLSANLPAGNYKLTAVAFTRTNYEAKLRAGENSTNIATVGNDVVNNREQGNTWIANGNGVTNLVFNLSEETSNLEIGLTAATQGDHWMCWRSFRLVYGDVFEPYTLVEGKMNAEVAAEQTTAENNYKANPSPATYQALMDAIAAAQASVDAYAKLADHLTKIEAALEAATTATASKEAYDAIKTAFNEGTIADADIMTKVAAAYDAVIPVIKSQTAASADFTLAIQNQSFEYGNMTGWTAASSSDTGVRETSNATYATTGSDGKYLFNTWWQGVPITQAVTDLPNGEYTLTVSVATDGGTIYLLANGEHNEGIETYATTNAEQGQYSKDTFQDATFTFLVKDGNATIGVVGGADGTAGEHKDYVEAGYWWYKADNFRLVKNRELTEEEQAVVPTGITLDKTVVTLTATENTVTLTPTFDPENATTTVTWTSSDENVATVADGVVTGVAPGTATITITSTLDANVKATCEVTVNYPESVVPATKEVAEGPALTITTLSQDNLFKNGSFGYPNAVYGWKTVGYTTDAVASNFTITAEGGAVDGGAYITTNGGGASSENTIRKSIAVEVGKKYYFAVYTSGKAPDANNLQYNALFKMSDATTEAGVLKQFEWPQGAGNTSSEWSLTEYIFTAETPYVGVRMGWNSSTNFDNFVLVEVTDENTVGNVQYALNAIPTANVGTEAFQYSQDAIDAVNALVQGTATVEDVEKAYAAVTTLNVPEPTQAYNLVFNCEGHTATGNALTLIPNPAQTQGLYGLKYLAPANVNLAQAFYFTHTTGNKYKVHAIDTNLKERYITTQAEGYGTTWYDGIRTIDDASKAMEIEIRPNGEGLYLLWNTGANKPLAHNGNNNNDLFTNNTANFQLVETSKPSIAINTTAAGWGTTILPFAVSEIPEGVKVYSCDAVDGATLTLTKVEALEANKPYIIEGTWEATLTGDAQGTALTYTEGLLTGVYTPTEAPMGSYVLQKHGNDVAFFKVSEIIPTVGANRAYLQVENEAKMFHFGGDATGISTIKALMKGDAEIYNISGVKQNSLQKGMNIIKMSDGTTRKLMVK